MPSTNSGEGILETCSLKSDFQGAFGRAEAEGTVDDMVERRRTRRRGAIEKAMLASLEAVVNSESCQRRFVVEVEMRLIMSSSTTATYSE